MFASEVRATPLTVGNFLREVRAVVEHGWTTGCEARKANGFSANYSDPEAVCWCLVGAYFLVSDTHFGWLRFGPEFDAIKVHTIGTISEQSCTVAKWNDAKERTLEDVLTALDNAAADPAYANMVM